jgi:hypothetical protein
LAGETEGLPLSVIVSATSANDSTMLEAVMEDIPPPLPDLSASVRDQVADRSAPDRVLGQAGRHRSTIERTARGCWLRRLRIRDERDSDRFYALTMLACAVICFNALQQPPCDVPECPLSPSVTLTPLRWLTTDRAGLRRCCRAAFAVTNQ